MVKMVVFGVLLAVLGRGAFGEVVIPVSKETTSVMGPVRGDGTMDYVAAINERFGKGVTPEKNGFVIFLKVMGTKVIPKAGRTEIPKLAGVVDAPAEGWVDWYARPGLEGADSERVDREMQYVTRHVWKASEHAEFAGYLKEREGLMALAKEASEKEQWWCPAAGENQTMAAVLLPALKPLKDVCRSMCARALLRAGEGDFEGFLSDVMTARRLARKVPGWTIIDVLVMEVIDRTADEAIGAAVGSGIFSAEQCARLGKECDGLSKLLRMADAVDVGERWSELDFVQIVAMGKHEQMVGGDNSWNSWLAKFDVVDREAVDWGTVLRRVNAGVDRELACLKKGSMEEQGVAWRAYTREVNRANRRGGLEKDADETREAYTDRVAARIISDFHSGIGGQLEADWHAEMMSSMARAVVALGQYRAEKGKWPESLEELAPGYLKALPVDVHAGGTVVVYEKKGEGVYLHSVREELGVGQR